MKKLYSFLTIVMMAIMAVSLTSCDDEEIAYTLEGTWEGEIFPYYEYQGSYYDISYTEICFVKDPYRYSSGTGYWVDYYDRGYWGGNKYIANHIEWRVDFETLYIYFVEDRYEIRISRYTLNDNYFEGVIEDNGTRYNFRLRHVSSPNWDRFDYGYYGDYYYSNENATGMQRAKAKDGIEPQAFQGPRRVFRKEEMMNN